MKNFAGFGRSLAACFAVLFIGLACNAQDIEFVGKVTEVMDGDSVSILDARQERHLVRLAGIDAPEIGQDFGKKARKFLSDLILEKTVAVSGSRIDRNGEFVGKVLVYGRDVGLEMVMAGFAWHFKLYANEQIDRDRQLFESAEFHARKSRFNLWSDSKPTPPWEFRNEPSEPTAIELRKLSRPTLGPPVETTTTKVDLSATSSVSATTPSIQTGEVLGNKNSKIYHWPGCPGYTRVGEQNRVMFKSRAEAEAAGYRAAKNCSQ